MPVCYICCFFYDSFNVGPISFFCVSFKSLGQTAFSLIKRRFKTKSKVLNKFTPNNLINNYVLYNTQFYFKCIYFFNRVNVELIIYILNVSINNVI